MKKFALYLFLSTTALFISCSDDDTNAPAVDIDQSLIPGDWNLTDIRSENGKFSATIEGLPLSGDYMISGKDYTASATFEESSSENEPNTVTGAGGFTLIGSFSVPTQEPIEEEQNIPDLIGTGEWSVKENMLSITSLQETTTYEITELTQQSMTLKIAIDEETTIDLQGQSVTISLNGDQFIVLTKQ